jgi:ribosomal protein L11 methyltransferase
MDRPYADLYIYFLQGRVTSRLTAGGGHFIGHWQEEDSAFLFFSSPAEAEVQALARRHPQLRLVDSYRMPYDQWQGSALAAERVGCFSIVPAWAARASGAPAGDGGIPIRIDPGVVFGSGTHPTTRDCLAALELAARSSTAGVVLDLGTGTGILAVAAAGLGHPRVLAVDLNHLAAQTAARNVRLNRLEATVLVVQGRAEDFIERPAQLVVANLHGAAMLRLFESRGFAEKRRLILSGLMRSEAKEVRHRLALAGLRIVEEWTREGIWHTYYAVREGSSE